MSRALETTLCGIVSAYNITIGFVGLKWAAFSQFLATVTTAHAAVNAWLSTISLVVGIIAGVLTIRNLRRK